MSTLSAASRVPVPTTTLDSCAREVRQPQQRFVCATSQLVGGHACRGSVLATIVSQNPRFDTYKHCNVPVTRVLTADPSASENSASVCDSNAKRSIFCKFRSVCAIAMGASKNLREFC